MTANGPGRIYVYSAPGYDTAWSRTVGGETVHGRGRFKVGYTGRDDPRVRIKEQTGTVYPHGEGIVVHLDEPAVRADGTGFTDHDVHKMLDGAGVIRSQEVVEATLDEIRAALTAVRTGAPFDPSRTQDFAMRPEQAAAVAQTAAYFRDHADDSHPPRFLWNAKMRFGKTFSTFQLAREMGWRRVLVLTFKPAVRNSWRDDLAGHVDFAGWEFADREHPSDPDTPRPLVWFASFQDLLGAGADGGVKEHNEDIHLIDWDCVVLDEYHFGAWQGAAKEVTSPAPKPVKNPERAEEKAAEAAAEDADEVIDLAASGMPRLYAATPDSGIDRDLDADDLRLSAQNFLYLSGTPFRALTEGEFTEDAIFNWTYPDEQAAKKRWDVDHPGGVAVNPYRELPQMQMFTYALSEMGGSEVGHHSDGMFDLSGYFEARKQGAEYHFADPARVGVFLDVLRGKLTQTAVDKLLTDARPPFPFSDARFDGAVDHSVWLMPTVASAHAMAATLAAHPYFRDFLVHVAAGAGAGMGAEAKAPVDRMLARAAKEGKQTITLSVGKLMTGVTVPQWGAILVLRSLKSPEAYFQAAFRVQSPWTGRAADGTRTVLKDTCFVFDFDPNRTLSLLYQYGTKLAGGSATAKPADEIGELVEHLPIFAFDGGRMEAVDVDAVMDWGTAGAGAAMLARRWGSPRLIDLSESVLSKLLDDDDLVGRLEQLEDFRNLREDAEKIIAQSKKVKEGKKRQADSGGGEPEDPEVVAARKAKREKVKTLRAKLIKFVQAVPVFMYLTDFREEALTDVIESLDTQLFERVTGLTLDDFHRLSEVGVFHPQHMNEAIWQFRLFERSSLGYLGDGGAPLAARVGLWDHSVDADTGPVITPQQ
ncbi:MAG: GIY-YIG nuclease family protein [Actinobacteria bacterium]|nr:GIY-YIG nuclease family protein [Actinomycetota bacterium]